MRKAVLGALSALVLLAGALLAGSAAAQTDVGSGNTLQTPPSAVPTKPAAGETSPSLNPSQTEELLGKRIVSSNMETLGRVEDVLLGPDSQPLQLIVSTEDARGVRGKEVAIDLARVEIRSDSADLSVADTTPQDIARMPAYTGDDTMTSLRRDRMLRPQ
ncbi:MAG TPA: PRC-barrel domain-containing protein [Azospirillum sp.]|nr:PRC-barrel domain-containing protein [Azospirillum sp.]